MRIAIVTDAWHPQVNGVVNTLEKTRDHLRQFGHQVEMLTHEAFRTIPCPTYPSIRLAIAPGRKLAKLMQGFEPDAIHIATEGPLGLATRYWCQRMNLAFTTSYHTKFPQYIRMRAPIPESTSYTYLRWFHGPSKAIMVPTPTVKQELETKRFQRVVQWTRGVDTTLFRPGRKDFLSGPKPRLIYVGRVAVEKNLEAFLSMDFPGCKYVVGDGPDTEMLRTRYPEARFVGYKFGEELAAHIASAELFVFPSRTDTFGLVMLEALACGVPVAAFPVAGPKDVITDAAVGCLHEDLERAARHALNCNPIYCRAFAEACSWERATRIFASFLVDNRKQSDAVQHRPSYQECS